MILDINQISTILSSLIIFIFFYISGKILGKLIFSKISINKENPFLVNLLGKSVKNIFIVIGLLTSLGTLGVDISALIAGLGITGFAVGFAMKDTMSNFISGVFLMLYTPFKLNDEISIDKYKGRVLEINLRYTVIDSNGNKILIPNSFVYSKPVEVLRKN